MEKRSLFNMIFGKPKKDTGTQTAFKLLNDSMPVFYNFSGNMYDSDTVRSVIHMIASSCAKLKPEHIRRTETKLEKGNSNLNYLLQVRPNQYMNTYDFIYKTVSQLYTTNNAFIYVKFDGNRVIGLYPVNYSSVELKEINGEMYAKFNFMQGEVIRIPYTKLIHIRRHYNKKDFFGDNANDPIIPTLEAINTTNQGIINAVKSSGRLRGIIKFVQSMLKPEDMQKERDRFVKDYMSINNDGGIAALDSKAEFQPVDLKFEIIDDKQMSVIRDNVYRYFNVSENIVMSKYTENEWNAFYESVIEPIAVQLSLEFTSKIFTDRERGFGNEIIFTANRLQYASATTKIALLRDLMPYGLLTINEGREVFNLPPVEDGDKRVQTLNVVDADKANKYQLGEEAEDVGETDKDI